MCRFARILQRPEAQQNTSDEQWQRQQLAHADPTEQHKTYVRIRLAEQLSEQTETAITTKKRG